MNITFKLPDKDSFNPREVAKALDLHVSTIFRFMLNGVRGEKLPWYLVGARPRIGRADLLAWLEAINAGRHDADQESRSDRRVDRTRESQLVEDALILEGFDPAPRGSNRTKL